MTETRTDGYTELERRRILLEHAFFATADEVCERWSVSRSEIQRWKRELGKGPFVGRERDWIVAALHARSQPATLAEVEDFLDWVNHCRYTDEEIAPILAELEREGLAKRVGDRWIDGRGPLGEGELIFGGTIAPERLAAIRALRERRRRPKKALRGA